MRRNPYLFLPIICIYLLCLTYSCVRKTKNTTIVEDTPKKEDIPPITVNTIFKLEKNSDNTYTILGLKEQYKDTTQITIPVQIGGIDVSTIGQLAFQNAKFTKLTFEPGSKLKTIQGSAFFNSSLTDTVIFPASIGKIGERAFWESKVKAIIFEPNSMLHTIESEAFAYSKLERILLPDLLKTIGIMIFKNCKNLKEVVLGNQMENISNSMFISCTSLNSITISNRIKTIEYGAFIECSNLVSVNIDIINSQLNTIAAFAFHNCRKIKDIKLPNNLTSIGENSFFNCVNLNSIHIGNNNTLKMKTPFANIEKLDIICTATEPPFIIGKLSMSTLYSKKINIYVPTDKVEEYKKATGWMQYATSIKAKVN